MTKEEAIKEAYGEYYDKLKNVITSNGWVSIHHMQEENVELDFEIKTEYEDGFPSDYARPKSLQGIEDNNGWVNIENQNDLPNIYTECHFELQNKDIQIGAYVDHKNIFVGLDEQYFPFEVIAYLPIGKPKQRIY